MSHSDSSSMPAQSGGQAVASAGREPGKTTTENPYSAYVFGEVIRLIKSGHSWESAVNSVLYGLRPLLEIKHLLERGYAPDVAARTAAELETSNWAKRCQPPKEVELPF